jgi:hypothetical protein
VHCQSINLVCWYWSLYIIDVALRLEGQHTGAVRQKVVIATRAGASSLVQELQVARIDGHRLVGVGANEIPVANVVAV